jgi:hypothetical protein
MLRGLLMVATLLVSASPPAADPLGDACVKLGAGMRSCTRSCFSVCNDASYVYVPEVRRICREMVAVRESDRKDEETACRGLLKIASTSPEATSNDDYDAIEQQCSKEYPDQPSTIIISSIKPAPSCLGTFARMECRLQKLQHQTLDYASTMKDVQQKNYGTVVDKAVMCRLKREEVERDFLSAKKLGGPLANLTKAYEKEFACLSEANNWIDQDLQCPKTDDPDKQWCDRRNSALRDDLVGLRKPSEILLATVRASLESTGRTMKEIQTFWAYFQVRCSNPAINGAGK